MEAEGVPPLDLSEDGVATTVDDTFELHFPVDLRTLEEVRVKVLNSSELLRRIAGRSGIGEHFFWGLILGVLRWIIRTEVPLEFGLPYFRWRWRR